MILKVSILKNQTCSLKKQKNKTKLKICFLFSWWLYYLRCFLKMIKEKCLIFRFPSSWLLFFTGHSVDVLLIIVAVNSNLTGGFKPCYIRPNATSMLIWLIFYLTKFGFQVEILLFTIIHVKKNIFRSFIWSSSSVIKYQYSLNSYFHIINLNH